MRARGSRQWLFNTVQVAIGFHRLAISALPERFPRLRWSFLESSSTWIPFALQAAARGTDTLLRRLDDNTELPQHNVRIARS